MEAVRRIRQERGLSQQTLADLADVNKVTLVRIESGKGNPNVETLEKLASALEVEMGDFFPKAQSPLFHDLPGAGEAGEEVSGARRSYAKEGSRDAIDEVSRDQLKQMLKRYDRVKQRLTESDDEDFKRHAERLTDRLIQRTIQALREKHERQSRPSEEQCGYPYPWMGDALGRLIDDWAQSVDERADPLHSHAIAVACIDVAGSVLRIREPGETLRDRVPENEVDERDSVVKRLLDIAERAQDHYRRSDAFDAAQASKAKQRHAEMRSLTTEKRSA